MTLIKLGICMALIAIMTLCAQEETNPSDYTFQQFEKQFGRTYQGEQRQAHRKAFNKNYQELLAIQKKNGGDFQVKVNNFTDMTDQEKGNFFNYRPTQQKLPFDSLPKNNKLRAIAVPIEFNYTAQGKVTPIKNQGKCGACWAFTATAMYESQLLIHGVGQYDLSEQYILQCTPGGSCQGGWPINALNTISDKGVPAQNLYQYKASLSAYSNDTICSTEDGNLVKLPLEIQSIKHYNSVPDSQLKQILLDKGPVSVGVRGVDTGLLYYSGGVFSGCKQKTLQNQIDHVVTLVGWTKEGNWIIKNSWGKGWGEKGYGIIDAKHDCGITHFVDVLDVKQPVIKNKDGDIAASPNEMEDLKITLTDSYGDGWNGYIFGVRQKNSIVTVFGQQFTRGAEQGPVEIEIRSGIQAQIVVVVAGHNSQQIGFKITDASGKQICVRQPGSKFSNDIVFCTICPSCEIPATITYELTLTDAANNGWNQNVLAFKQDGVLTKFGEQFVNGDKYGPRSVQFTRNVPVQIVAYKIGQRPQDIGFQIRDSFGNIVFKRQTGTQFTPDSKLGQFCPGCSNFFPVNTRYIGQSRQVFTTLRTETDNSKILPFIIAVAILSALVLTLIGIIVYKQLMKKRSQNDSSFSKKQFQGVSILGSTATIPDQSPDVARSPDPNKVIPSTQQIKLN